MKKILLLSSSLALSLIIAEFVFRIYLFGHHGVLYSDINKYRLELMSGIMRKSNLENLLYELRPNIKKNIRGVLLKTNSLGLHDKEYDIVKNKNTYRIAIVGDSISMPSGVTYENAYHSLWEDELNRQSQDTKFEVINFSVAGYSIGDYKEVVINKVAKYNVDHIFIGLCLTNDHLSQKSQKLNQRFKNTPDDQLRVEKWNHTSFWTSHLYSTISKLPFFYTKNNASIDYNDKDISFLTTNLNAIKKWGLENNINLTVAAVSSARRFPERIKALKLISKKHNIDFIDLLTIFPSYHLEKYKVSTHDKHPSVLAHKVLGQELLKFKGVAELLKEVRGD
jgi:hypothetical protein